MESAAGSAWDGERERERALMWLPSPAPRARGLSTAPWCVLSPDPVTTPGCPVLWGCVRGGRQTALPHRVA
eukprot:776611-Prymnesium_polylepis.2